jgi:putative aminopeptidase FrvX
MLRFGMMRFLSGFLATATLILFQPSPLTAAGLRFQAATRQVVQQRLDSYSRDNTQREAILKKMFVDAGCGDHISEEPVKHLRQPDLICVLPGEGPETIIVGAHFDHVNAGDGVVDNWSGASLLPSLYQGLRALPPRHTFIFVAFAGEEQGEVGSRAYVRHMSREELAQTRAMINMDSLGLGQTEMWLTHADPFLAATLMAVAKALNLPLGVVNVDQVGSSDSEQFAQRKIPRITIHSVTQETLPILHTGRDNSKAIRMDDYYDTYRLVQGFLAYLDGTIGRKGSAAGEQPGNQK